MMKTVSAVWMTLFVGTMTILSLSTTASAFATRRALLPWMLHRRVSAASLIFNLRGGQQQQQPQDATRSISQQPHHRLAASVQERMEVEATDAAQQLELFYGNRKSDLTTIPTVFTDSGTTATSAATMLQDIDTVLFDCDGVLYRTLETCPDAARCIRSLQDSGKSVLFVTNHGGINRRQLRDKLQKLLGDDVTLINDMMVSSSYSCAEYLKQQLQPAEPKPWVHVIGSAGLVEEIENAGFHVTTVSPDTQATMDRQQLASFDFASLGPDDRPLGALAIGHDVDFTFRKMSIAVNLLLQHPDALFVATNEDSFDLVSSTVADANRHIPGNGCVIKALEHGSQRTATNVGKPSQTLADLLGSTATALDCSRALFVGDRLDTDIRFGHVTGMKTLLVMTGVTTVQKMENLGCGTIEEPLPTYIAPHVGYLVV